jgi:pyridoxine kinase
MGRVLAVSSQTVYGPVGLSAAVPALEALGHEVLALPTILLSHHPGHGVPAGQATPAPLLTEMWDSLARVGALKRLDAVLTGYFASVAQVIAVAERLVVLGSECEELQVLVDPVIGDHGKLYVPVDVAEAIRDRLLPLATITTPNVFELEWLSGEASIRKAVNKLAVRETLVTSALRAKGQIANMLFSDGDVFESEAPHLAHVPHGTGDFLAAAYLGQRITQQPQQAFAFSMHHLQQVIAQSTGSATLKPHLA